MSGRDRRLVERDLALSIEARAAGVIVADFLSNGRLAVASISAAQMNEDVVKDVACHLFEVIFFVHILPGDEPRSSSFKCSSLDPETLRNHLKEAVSTLLGSDEVKVVG